MPLTAGEKLGPYEIISLIGKGGMGEVYRTRDTRIGRDVAALNHPNTCTLYDVGPNYLTFGQESTPAS